MIHANMTSDAYHASAAISASALNAMSRSMFHFWSDFIAPDRPPREVTPAMRAGTLAHTAILEPHAIHDRYRVRPADIDGRTKEGRAWAASVPPGVEIVTAEQMATAAKQRAAVLDVPEVARLLASGAAEQSVFWTDAATGVDCRCRPDWVHTLPDGRVILVDLKTTSDAAPSAFARSVWNFGYHRQAAHYVEGYTAAAGVEVAAFVFVAVTGAYPFVAVPYMLDEEAMERGRAHRAQLLRRYVDCKTADRWPAYGDGVQLLTLPAWTATQGDDQ